MRDRRASEAGISRVQLGSWIALACLLGLVLPLSASSKIFGMRSSAPAGYTYGIQTIGAMGVPQTVSDAMVRQAHADLLGPRPPRMHPEHEVDREDLPQNPESPDVASSGSSFDPSVPAIPPGSPQTPGTSFTGATLTDTGAFPRTRWAPSGRLSTSSSSTGGFGRSASRPASRTA